MTRILWLVFERVPHPDAVAYPAGEDDARFVRELFALPYAERLRLAGQLRRFEASESVRPAVARRFVSCRMPSGLYHPVPWRLARWLARVLIADEAVISRAGARIDRWLNHAAESPILIPAVRQGRHYWSRDSRISAQPRPVG